MKTIFQQCKIALIFGEKMINLNKTKESFFEK